MSRRRVRFCDPVASDGGGEGDGGDSVGGEGLERVSDRCVVEFASSGAAGGAADVRCGRPLQASFAAWRCAWMACRASRAAAREVVFSSRLAFRCAWSRRVEGFYQRANAQTTTEDLAEHFAFYDPLVASWISAKVRGLQARVVGGVRVRGLRLWPWGEGVNRRRRPRRQRVSPVPACSRVAGWWVQGGDDPVVPGVATLPGLSSALGSAPDVLGGWRNKCLQNAVLYLAQGSDRERLARVFARLCSNDCPSGGSGRTAQLNLYFTQNALRRLGVYVRVVSSRREASLFQGRLRGTWSLGDVAGRCLGVLAWFEETEHVATLSRPLGGEIVNLLGSFPAAGAVDVEPWTFFAAGAPKKTSKRGAHLTAAARAARRQEGERAGGRGRGASGGAADDAAAVAVRCGVDLVR